MRRWNGILGSGVGRFGFAVGSFVFIGHRQDARRGRWKSKNPGTAFSAVGKQSGVPVGVGVIVRLCTSTLFSPRPTAKRLGRCPIAQSVHYRFSGFGGWRLVSMRLLSCAGRRQRQQRGHQAAVPNEASWIGCICGSWSKRSPVAI